MVYTDRQARLTILSLALGAFAIGVTEFAAMGLLPYYALDLGVTEPEAGFAVSGYAIGVVVGAPVLAVQRQAVDVLDQQLDQRLGRQAQRIDRLGIAVVQIAAEVAYR